MIPAGSRPKLNHC